MCYYWRARMEKKLKVELKQAKKNLDTWYSHGNCDDPETEEWLKGIIFGLEKAMSIYAKEIND